MRMTDETLDALTEILNIGIGRAAASLSRMVETRVELRVPEIELIELNEDSTYVNSTSFNMSCPPTDANDFSEFRSILRR